MDEEHQSRRTQGDEQEQWDRWNSNSSHNSYYTQPTHRPYGQAFTTASLILGFLSVTVGWIGLALPLGALGVLFALLTYRRKKPMSGPAKTGLILSCAGGILGAALLLLARFAAPYLLQQQLKDEAYRQQFEAIYNAVLRDSLGMDFEDYLDYMADTYGVSFEEE